VQREIKLAKMWFEKAATLNEAEAQENLKRLEQAGLIDGAQIAARRAFCLQTCTTFQRSYVGSVCERYSAIADGDNPERTKCVSMSLTLAQQCRGSCREWALTSLADNKCMACFQTLNACSTSEEPPDSQANQMPYELYSKGCLSALADCIASCRGQTASSPRRPNTNGKQPN
jgi:TPR repeat protein